MRNSSKRWTALVLLLLAAATATTSAGTMFCTYEAGLLADTAVCTANESSSSSSECPLAQLAEHAATPMVLSATSTSGAIPPLAYVRPLFALRSYWMDPEPPVKPPAA